jgi:hypothetical protein
VDRQDRVPRIVLFEKQGAEFPIRKVLLKALQGLAEFGFDRLAFAGEFGQDLDLFLLLPESIEELDVPFQSFFPLLKGLEGLLVLPDVRRGEPLDDGLPVLFFAVEVKETPGAPRTWRSRFRYGFRCQMICR